MTHNYQITGMTCGGCVAKVKSELLKLGDITGATIQLSSPQAVISMQKHITTDDLQSAVAKAGNYKISMLEDQRHTDMATADIPLVKTYKPLLLILFYLLAVTAALSFAHFHLMTAMNIFMSGFFLVFSFFKLLDLRGFADSYSMYDVIAKKIPAWGFIYPFTELALGIAFAVHFSPLFTNIFTLVLMCISLTGVLQSIFNKQKIRCACLGTVFNLPMGTITVIEDLLMIAMSGIMLIQLT